MHNQDDRSIGYDYLVAALGIVVLMYIAGAYSAMFGIFPYQQVFHPIVAPFAPGSSEVHNRGTSSSSGPAWYPTTYDNFGTVRHEPKRTQTGPVLVSSTHQPGAVLIDRAGEVIHKWHVPFDQAWPSPDHVPRPSSTREVHWQHATLLEDGDLLANYVVANKQPPYGYGLARIDASSNVEWTFDGRAHGSVAVGPNGDIYTMIQTLRDVTRRPIEELPQIGGGRIIEDVLVRLTPEGTEKQRVSMLDALRQSEYLAALTMFPETVERPAEKLADPLHADDVEVIGPEFASHFSQIDPGHVLVSLRAVDLVTVVDLTRRRVVWASRGGWWQQADADPLPNGHLQLFDANGHGGAGGFSRILEVDPKSIAVEWMYSGTDTAPFWSYVGGEVQRLPGGNRLITASASGRVLEVSPEGDIVWEYHNPARASSGEQPVIAGISTGTWIQPKRAQSLR